tara:strand:+ start:649610 stop:650632 length:1023 start_codon:yes stop_codon:yes gene_type:complete
MSLSYIEQYITQTENAPEVVSETTAQTKPHDEDTAYHDFSSERMSEEYSLYKQKLIDLENQKKLIEAQHQNEMDKVTYLMRFRHVAQRVALAVQHSFCEKRIVNVQKSVIDSVNSLSRNCGNDLDDDKTYKMLFSQIFIKNDQVNIKSKAEYQALCLQLEENNAQIASNAVYKAAEKRFEAIKNEPAGDKYGQRIIAGFAEVEDILQQGSQTIGFDLDSAYNAALSRFDIYSEDSFNSKLKLALRKISAVNLLQDLDRFKLNIGQVVTPEFIKDLETINISADRFQHAKLPVKNAEELSTLTSSFIDALRNGQYSGAYAKDIAYITQELKSPSYIVHGLI